jgi:hypothetical protein
MPEPETRRTAEQIIRDFKPGEGLTPWPYKPLTCPAFKPVIPARLWGATAAGDEETGG